MAPAPVLAHLDAEERGHVGDACSLLHVVRDDHDRVVVLELVHQVLDARGRDRIERRSRLVHQDHVRLDGERARDAEALLLAAGEPERVVLEPVLHLVPERRLTERALDALVEIVLHAEHLAGRRRCFVDRLRKRVRLLEHHPDAPAHLDRIDGGGVEVTAVVEDVAVDGGARHEVVHAVEAADERALAAPRRPDERRHVVLADVEIDVLERDVAAVGDRQPGDLEHGLGAPAVGRGAGELPELATVDVRRRHVDQPAGESRHPRAGVGCRMVNDGERLVNERAAIRSSAGSCTGSRDPRPCRRAPRRRPRPARRCA